jgi:hypothetical protein
MKYFIKREDKEYGPYSLADLQTYVQQGNVSPNDLARSEGMPDWGPVSTIIGTITVPVGGGFGAAPALEQVRVSLPPNMHWAVLLLLAVVTCNLFTIVWLFVNAVWVRKVRPGNRALFYLIAYFAAAFSSGYLGVRTENVGIVLNLVGVGFFLAGVFSIRGDMEDYFNHEENIGMRLSGVMTFFFSTIYFQYHFNEVNERRRAEGVIVQ